MRRPSMGFAAAAAAALLAWGCASRPAPVRVSATPADLRALAGEWSGEYSSRETGRSGTIQFRITAESDTAYGDVLMIPRGSSQPLRTADPLPPAGRRPEALAIRFVRIEGGSVSGVLEPYRDPACGCAVETTFTGRLTSANRIEGTFATRGAGARSWHTPAGGRWQVTRENP